MTDALFCEHAGGFKSLKDALHNFLTQPQNHSVEASLNTHNTFLPCFYLPLNLLFPLSSPISQLSLRHIIWSLLLLLLLHLAPNLMDFPASQCKRPLLYMRCVAALLPTNGMVLLLTDDHHVHLIV